MTTAEVLSTLKRLGKPQTAAIYQRLGSGDNVFGVLTSEIAKLQKKIKADHALAMELWKTGNAEARGFARAANNRYTFQASSTSPRRPGVPPPVSREGPP